MSRKFVGVMAVAGLVVAGGLGVSSRDAAAGGFGWGYSSCGYGGCGYSGCGYASCGYSSCGYAACSGVAYSSCCSYSPCGGYTACGGYGYSSCGYSACGYSSCSGYGYGGYGYGGWDPWSSRRERYDWHADYGMPAYRYMMNRAWRQPVERVSGQRVPVGPVTPEQPTASTLEPVSAGASHDVVEIEGQKVPVVRLAPH